MFPRRILPALISAPMLVAALAAAVLVAPPAVSPAEARTPRPSDSGSSAGPTARHSLRAPVTDENFYFVMADRFENGNPANDTAGLGADPLVSGSDPTKAKFYNGGDLAGILNRMDYIEDLGTTSLWLTPSFKNKPVQLEDGPSAGYHGYWVTDFTQIDPHLGTNEELRAVVDEAHARGMKVYFDIITNHTADVIGYEEGARKPYISKDEAPYKTASGDPFDDRDFAGQANFPAMDAATSFPYTPVLEPGEENLKSPAWLNDPTLYHNRGDTTFAGENSLYGDFFGLDDLFTENPRVVNGMIDVYSTWIRDFGIDGFRIDTMKHVDDAFWQKFGPAVLKNAKAAGKKEFFMFGEVFDTTRSFTSQFTTRNTMQAVLDFPFQDAARNFASRSRPASELGDFFVKDDWYTDRDSNVYQLPTFLGNHDMGRIGALLAADNTTANEAELLQRSRLAHELMYFSRGNPVVYYGDEQGFTGTTGFEGSRQSMFASRVDSYLDDNLLGTDATHATDNFNQAHPLYGAIRGLAKITRSHPALRDGAHQHRFAADNSGIYAFSRTDRKQQREYVVALNNSSSTQTASIPTYVAGGKFTRIYASASASTSAKDSGRRVTTGADRTLKVTVPPLSAVVYAAADRIPRSTAAPAITLAQPEVSAESNSRMHVTARVAGTSFYEVSFEARPAGGSWEPIGTDDTAPYQVFHDTSGLASGTSVEYRAVVRDNRGNTAASAARSARVPAPALTIDSPAENGTVSGRFTVTATADPERATHEVSFERRVAEGDWTPLGTDSSSPAYTAFDDASTLAEGTRLQYRATLTEPDGTTVTSAVRTVTVSNAIVQPQSVAVAGDLDSELGCPGDWQPECDHAQMTFDPQDQLWKLTANLPAGSYQYKAALNRSWTENYGADGVRDGNNIQLTHDGGSVTFVYNHRTHVIGTVP